MSNIHVQSGLDGTCRFAAIQIRTVPNNLNCTIINSFSNYTMHHILLDDYRTLRVPVCRQRETCVSTAVVATIATRSMRLVGMVTPSKAPTPLSCPIMITTLRCMSWRTRGSDRMASEFGWLSGRNRKWHQHTATQYSHRHLSTKANICCLTSLICMSSIF